MNEVTTVDYRLLNAQVAALTDGESDLLANCANVVALLYESLPDINWLGLYVLRGGDLVLGPFQGKPACVRIPLGQGVCGTAASLNSTQRIYDVHAFAGHIACDEASNSEIVVPLSSGGNLVGVLDIDSPSFGRFSEADQYGIEMICRTFEAMLEKNGAGPGFI